MMMVLALLLLIAADVTREDADALLRHGSFREAADAYLILLRQSPSDPDLIESMGQTLLALHQSAQAVRFFRRELEISPGSRKAAQSLGAALEEANDIIPGRQVLTKLTQDDPADAKSWYHLGLLMYRNGYYEAAASQLDHALAAGIPEPWRNTASIARAVSLLQTGQAEEAEKSLRQLLSQPANAGNLDLLLGYARLLYESGRFNAAMQNANRAVEADAQNPSAHFWRARILQQQDHLPEAATAAEKSRDLAPDSPAPRNLLILIYRKQGRAADAAREAAWLRTHENNPQ